MELPVEVLVEWNKKTANWNLVGPKVGIKRIVTWVTDKHFKIERSDKTGDTGALQLIGFIEFYNQFYKLDNPNSAKQWKKEGFYNTKLLVPTPEISAQVQKLLFSLGWAWGSDRRTEVEHDDR